MKQLAMSLSSLQSFLPPMLRLQTLARGVAHQAIYCMLKVKEQSSCRISKTEDVIVKCCHRLCCLLCDRGARGRGSCMAICGGSLQGDAFAGRLAGGGGLGLSEFNACDHGLCNHRHRLLLQSFPAGLLLPCWAALQDLLTCTVLYAHQRGMEGFPDDANRPYRVLRNSTHSSRFAQKIA